MRLCPRFACLGLHPGPCARPREALTAFTPRQLRLMFVLQPWNRPMVYGEQSRNEVRAREGQLKNFFQNVDAAVRAVDVNAAEARWQVRPGAAGGVGMRGRAALWGVGGRGSGQRQQDLLLRQEALLLQLCSWPWAVGSV